MSISNRPVSLKHEFTLGVYDFNNFQQIPPSALLKYSTEARWVAFATWPALAKLIEEDVSAEVLTKIQVVRFLHSHNKCVPGMALRVTQTPHAVGATSLTLAYDFFDGDSLEAFAQVLTVLIRVKDGTTLPLPDYVTQDLTWRHRQMEVENSKDLTVFSTAIAQAEVPSLVTNTRLSYELLVRPSDTDRSKVVRSVRLAQFFEDALVTNYCIPDLFYFEVLSNVHSRMRCDIFSTVPREGGDGDFVSFLVERDTGKILARSFVSFNTKEYNKSSNELIVH